MSTNEDENPKGYGRGAYGSGPYGDVPDFRVTIVSTNSPVNAGEPLDVEVQVENTGGDGSQTIELELEEIDE